MIGEIYPLPLAVARWQNSDMSTSPQRPGAEPEIDPETERIIRARLSTLDEDRKTAVDAKEFLTGLKKKLADKHPVPRGRSG